MEKKLRATLRLRNGMELRGWSFGYDKPCDGEVVFSTAMVGYPDVIILDEPTVGMDPKQIIEIRELIKKLSKILALRKLCIK